GDGSVTGGGSEGGKKAKNAAPAAKDKVKKASAVRNKASKKVSKKKVVAKKASAKKAAAQKTTARSKNTGTASKNSATKKAVTKQSATSADAPRKSVKKIQASSKKPDAAEHKPDKENGFGTSVRKKPSAGRRGIKLKTMTDAEGPSSLN
ncbi:MAG: hypothetical protein HKP55_15485, partial [Gammaproteobacteria bacterium]|nr:hypothetical protein [Gammaproteobacteria bacterium]